VARISRAEDVAQAKKLLKLELDLGDGRFRTVFAGIKAAYRAEDLVGRLAIVVANLKPRTMKFGVSEGMILAAGGGDGGLFLLSVDAGARPGQSVR
jgi:methionyl-tRNA synthetase